MWKLRGILPSRCGKPSYSTHHIGGVPGRNAPPMLGAAMVLVVHELHVLKMCLKSFGYLFGGVLEMCNNQNECICKTVPCCILVIADPKHAPSPRVLFSKTKALATVRECFQNN